MAAVAARHGAGYLRREDSSGAKAGNINHALRRTDAPFVLVLDCDHVPEPHFLEATLGWFENERMAFVQTPQYYANWDRGEIPGAAWAQQAPALRAGGAGQGLRTGGHGALRQPAAALVARLPVGAAHRAALVTAA